MYRTMDPRIGHPPARRRYTMRRHNDNETEDVELLFKEFDPQTAKKLVESGIEASFEPGQFIFKEDDRPSQLYLITQGSVALEQPGPPHAIRIQTLHEGHFLGWTALLDSGTRQFQARALTRVVVLTFDGSFLRRACEEDPQFGYALCSLGQALGAL